MTCPPCLQRTQDTQVPPTTLLSSTPRIPKPRLRTRRHGLRLLSQLPAGLGNLPGMPCYAVSRAYLLTMRSTVPIRTSPRPYVSATTKLSALPQRLIATPLSHRGSHTGGALDFYNAHAINPDPSVTCSAAYAASTHTSPSTEPSTTPSWHVLQPLEAWASAMPKPGTGTGAYTAA